MKAVQLAPDTVHLTYDTDHNGRRAHRSSLWRRTGGAWLLYFHQGTPYDANAVTGGWTHPPWGPQAPTAAGSGTRAAS
ncbi:hypothetical protein ACFP51_06310 [Streptomyces pratens]|uniref:DUF4440 domain-containing protein n=1 Tax=Streptomyces pratens TaxID=887456 RepID=A0ABW1M5L2_9ACTN